MSLPQIIKVEEFAEWPEAEIVGWPKGRSKKDAWDGSPHVIVRRCVPDIAGPNGEALFSIAAAGTHISLFTGCGGFDLGMERAGFVSLVQHEWDPTCCETLLANRPNCFRHSALIQGDIRKTPTSMILGEAGLRVGEAHVLTGGPPCQGFSTSNGNRRQREIDGDARNDLVFQFLRVIREAQPRFFIMENVPGFLSFNKGAYFDAFLRTAHAGYYELVYGLVNAVEYGVPQDRCRFICVGTRRDLHEIDGCLGGLPAPQTFSERDLQRIKLWTPQPLFMTEELELLLHPPGIRYFPDRPVLIPPRPTSNIHSDDEGEKFDAETGKPDGGRSKTFIEFYRHLRREEPDRIVTEARDGSDRPMPPATHDYGKFNTVGDAIDDLPALRSGLKSTGKKGATA